MEINGVVIKEPEGANDHCIYTVEENDIFEEVADDESFIPENLMDNKEKQRLIKEIIDNELTVMQKICITNYYYNDMKQSEIAKSLQISENTVKTNLSRAKAKIKDAVLRMEKEKGTRLYSITPFMLLLFRKEIASVLIPTEWSALLISKMKTLKLEKTALAKTLAQKIAASSAKTKIIGGIVGIGATGAIGAVVLIPKNEIPDEAGYFKGHYYYVQELDDMTWEEAEEYFESLGGHLMTISSKEENDYAIRYMMEEGYTSAYFGFTDAKTEGEWEWITGEQSNYTNWAEGEPNSENPTENYAMFYNLPTNLKWNDSGAASVANTYVYLCEWDKK